MAVVQVGSTSEIRHLVDVVSCFRALLPFLTLKPSEYRVSFGCITFFIVFLLLDFFQEIEVRINVFKSDARIWVEDVCLYPAQDLVVILNQIRPAFLHLFRSEC